MHRVPHERRQLALFTRRRDHTFQPPVPELTARYGVPNACTTCHEDKSPEWAAETMDT